MIKHVIFVILLGLSLTSFAQDSFNEHFDYSRTETSEHADKITQFFTEDSKLSHSKRIELFKQFNQSISLQIKTQPNMAILWFIKGLNYKNRLTVLEEISANKSVIEQTKQYMEKSFLKAIQVDGNNKKSQLTPIIYGTIKHNLEGNDRITALQKELSLGGSTDNESMYWFSHWDMIGSLQQEGRFDEAEDALYTMQNELEIAGLQNSHFSTIYQKAKSTLSKDHILSKAKETQAKKDYKPNLNSRPQASDRPIFESFKTKLGEYWFMILLNTIVFISLIFAFLRREKD